VSSNTITAEMPGTREEMVRLLSDYISPRKQEEFREALGLSRHGGFRAPEKVLIIIFPSRAGSNYFGQLLSSTGWFNVIGESFHPNQLEAVRQREGLQDLHDAAQWMIDNRGTEHAFGFKAGFGILAAAAELGFLHEVIGRADLLLLRRRDRVGQAISSVKGIRSGRMHSRQQAQRELTDDDYDAEAIASQIAKIRKGEDDFVNFVERLGKPAPLHFYEDICANPEQHVRDVCEMMGLQMPENYEPMKVKLEILRDELNDRWAERFRNEHPDIH
jgi:LPS sulfotransferase NodH